MKFIVKLCLISSFFLSYSGYAQEPFTIKVEIPPIGGEFKIPVNPDYNYNYTVEWGDGETSTNVTSNISHSYFTGNPFESKEFTIKIYGDFPAIDFHTSYSNNENDHSVVELMSWGSIEWESFNEAFRGCKYMKIASDAGVPDLTNVNDLSDMFHGCEKIDADFSNWDISSITAASGMFQKAFKMSTENFDATILGWATDITGVVDGNDDIPNGLDFGIISPKICSSVDAVFNLIDNYGWTFEAGFSDDCNEVFSFTVTIPDGGSDFVIPINTSSSLTYDYYVDWGDDSYSENQTLDATHTYTNTSGSDKTYQISIYGDFPAIEFQSSSSDSTNDQMITEIKSWGTIEWKTFSQAFWGCSNLTVSADAGAPDLSNVTSLFRTFRGCSSLNSDGGWENWDTSSITVMVETFDACVNFNGDVSSRDVSNVTNMVSLFLSCHIFNQDISNWDVGKVTNMEFMFAQAYAFNQDITGWETGKVTNMFETFRNADSFDYSLGSWDISSVTNMENIFWENDGMSVFSFDATMNGWDIDTSGTAGDGIDDIPSNIDMGSLALGHCSAGDAITDLTTNYGWTITSDFSYDCGFTFEVTVPPGGSQFPIYVNSNYTYDYDVDWGNGVVTTDHTGATATFYSNATGDDQVYTVKVIGTFPAVYYDNDLTYAPMITKIVSWGDIQWESFENAFNGCINMTIEDDIRPPNLMNTTSLEKAFKGCTSLDSNSGWESWDTSSITNMQAIFNGCDNFNGDISGWNTRNVTNMRDLFKDAPTFDQSLANWDLTSLTDLSDIFNGASGMSVANYDATIIGWGTDSSGTAGDGIDDIPQLVAMGTQTPKLCDAVNTAISLENYYFWAIDSTNTSSDCDNDDTAFIFKIKVDSTNPSFTIPVNPDNSYIYLYRIDWGDGTLLFDGESSTHTYSGLSTTPTEFTIKIYGAFPAIDFSAPQSNDINDKMIFEIVNWGTIDWRTFENAFDGCTNLTIASDAGAPNLTNVTNLSNAFIGCTSLNSDANWENWDVSTITNMSGMFFGCSSFNGAISGWNIANVKDLSWMFNGASLFNVDISGWSTNNVISMSRLFRDTDAFNYSLENWNISSVSDIEDMFQNANAISTSNFDATLTGWYSGSYPDNLNLGVVTPTYCLANAIVLDLVENHGWTIQANLASDCEGVFSFDIVIPDGGASFTLPTLTSTYSYNYFVNWGDGTFNNNATTQLTHHYSNSTGAELTYTISIEGTFPVMDFYANRSVTNPLMITQINNWGAAEWESFEGAYRGCSNLTISPDAGVPDLSNATSLEYAFYDCSALNSDAGWENWDVSTITNMTETFYGATNFNGDISNWNVSNVTNMSALFKNTDEFDQPLENWDISSVMSMLNIFENANAYYFENFDNALIAWAAATTIPSNINLGTITPEYCASTDAITELTTNHGWTINATYTERCNNFTIDGLDGLVFQQSSRDFSLDLSDDFTAYGIGVGEVDITMDYTVSTDTYVVSGDVTTSFEGNDIETTMSLTVTNEQVVSLSFGVTSTFELYSLSFEPDGLTFQYDLTDENFQMYGGATISFDGNSIDVVFGDEDNPGIIIQDGDLQQLIASITADFTISELSFAPDNLTFVYNDSNQLYELYGGATITFDGNDVDLVLGDEDDPGIEIENGSLKAINASITADFEIFDLGFSPEDLTFVYSSGDDLYELYGSATVSFDGNEVSIGLGDEDTPGIEIDGSSLQSLNISISADFDIADVTISPNDLTFVYDKDNSYYEMYGSATFTVDGNDINLDLGDDDSPGIVFSSGSVDAINASITADFSMKDIDFTIDSMGLQYSKDDSSYEIFGTASASFDGESMSITLGTSGDPGFQYYDAAVQVIDISITGDFSLKEISIQPDDLTFIYSKQDDQFEMYGDVTITVVGDSVEAILGDEDDPGMILQNGTIQHVNFGVTTDFSISGLTLDVTDVRIDWTSGGLFNLYGDADLKIAGDVIDADFGTDSDPGVVIENAVLKSLDVDINSDIKLGNLEVETKSLVVKYSDDIFDLSGELEVKEVFSIAVTLGTDSQPGVEIDVSGSEPKFKIEDLTIDIEHGNLGAIDLKQLKLEFNSVGILESDLKIVFPEGWEVDGTMKFKDINGKAEIDEISLAYQADNLDDAIEIFEGVQLTYLGGSVSNLTKPSQLEVSAGIGTIYGGGFTLDNKSATFVAMTDNVTVSSKEFKISGDVDVGAYRTGTNEWNSLLGEGSIDLTAYFHHYVKATVNAKYPGDPLIQANLTAYFDSSGHFDGLLDVEFIVPHWVPFVGGKHYGSVDGAVRYKKGDLDGSFGAAWVRIATFWHTYHEGAKYNFGSRHISSIGSGSIDDIESTINHDEGNRSTTSTSKVFDFEVVQPAPDLMLIDIDWDGTVDEALVTVIGPEGTYELTKAVIVSENAIDETPTMSYEENMTTIAQDTVTTFLFSTATALNENDAIKPKLTTGNYQLILSFPGTETEIDSVQIKPKWQIPESNMIVNQTSHKSFDLEVDYWSSLPDSTLVSFYVNTVNSYDGGRLINHVQASNFDTSGNGTETLTYLPKYFEENITDVYFYAVIEDGINPPFQSVISSAYTIEFDVVGSITVDDPTGDVVAEGLRIFIDLDNDGSFDTDSTGDLEPFSLINEDGEFSFPDLDSGTYNLRVVLPKGYRLVGGTDNFSSQTLVFDGTPQQLTLQIETY